MLKQTVRALAGVILIAALGACSNGSSSSTDADTSTEVSKFIGLWHMSLKSDASDPGFDWRFNDDGTTVYLYNTGNTTVKGSGSCTISDETATGTWQVDSTNRGTFNATLTGDDSMDFDFIESKYSPAKTFSYTASRLEGPSGSSSSSSSSSASSSVDATDELDPSLVTWDCPAGDVGSWKITSKITSADITAERIRITRDPDDNWPSNSSSKPSVGNWWIIGKYNGQWYGATVDWIGVGRTETDTPRWDGTDGLKSTLDAWRPVSGETAYVMQSTHARAGVEIAGNEQRTNIVKVTMP